MLVSLMIFAALFIFALSRLIRERPIKLWHRKLNLDKHFKTYLSLYSNIDGFALSKAARKEIPDSLEYTYGEIKFEPFIALLSLCQPSSSTIFYDLGSGTGRAVIACALVFNVKKSCGIEIFPQLHDCAKQQQQRLSQLGSYQDLAKHIEFKLGNLLETPIEDASLVFINATTFFSDTWLAISKHLEQIKPGALVISTSKSLQSNLFQTVRETRVEMSWGVVKAFIQKRQAA
ncbi:methyltransferase domain-containing protein [Legionella jordanis]|uniref:Histone-lysine N-methyltransferase, H3 lysine-79 specific n=1 Tax=Legionella jordanis TaxID=456 RepID=A0A0W0VD27_9GAMM|nr:methyltransferase domain-containing protein [Legionella jordanis]KTD18023.1 putative methyltransferase [Legionella jordanis]RMX02290.1 methyltransferase domain-containing protein [Legionella jordanis]RMX21225.1 methyltransferase domain-containing protein [Legionella jordanis]VEH13885.1 putative methyltransferases [Legionella jordanis]HAT8714267.1 methyltransferase domain-containing protein [Legionella jordanis]